MASSYTSNLRLEKMVTGEKRSTWGNLANTIFEMIEDAISGWVNVTMGDTNYSLTTNNSTEDEARQMMINFSETLTANRTLTIPSTDKMYFMRNATAGGFDIVVSNGTNTVTVANGESCFIFNNGTNATIYKSHNILSSTLDGLDGFDTNGILTQTASNTFAARTITGTTDEIDVADGDGVAGNPTLTLPTQLAPAAGSAAAPTYTFTSDKDTGLYRKAANQPAVAAGGTEIAYFDSTTMYMPAATTENRIIEMGTGRGGDGLSAIDLIGDSTYTDYGLRIIRFGGANSASQILHRGTGNLLFQTQEAGSVLLGTEAVTRVTVSTTSAAFVVPIYGDNTGTAAAPTYSFNSDADTGMYRKAANQLGFATSGTEQGYIDASGNWYTTGAVTASGVLQGSNMTSTTILSDDRMPTCWVVFDGVANTIGDHYNVSSIVDNGTGDYTINFDSALADTDYVVLATVTGLADGNVGGNVAIKGTTAGGADTKTTAAVKIQTGNGATGTELYDFAEICVLIFGGD